MESYPSRLCSLGLQFPLPTRLRLPVSMALMLVFGCSSLLSIAGPNPEMEAAISTIKAVGSEGKGNEAAAAALAKIATAAKGDDLPALVGALDGASPLAANWLRSAAQTLVEHEQKAGNELALVELGALLFDQSRGINSRLAAFEILEQSDQESALRLVPGFLGDSAPKLRYLAVQQLIDQAAAVNDANPSAAALLYRQALGSATDAVQVETIATALEKQNQSVDLPRHFGFLTHWQVLAPFDNTNHGGFGVEFPPEKGSVELDASYTGKDGESKISWQPFATTNRYGKVDLNVPFGLLKGVTGYAYTEFESDSDRPAELRLGCKNGWKVWFNGEFLFGRDEYHRGQQIDQYRLPVQLKKGRNTVLVKLCQDEQEERWTVEWEFQLRVCDSNGVAILAPDRLPTPVKETTSSRRGSGAKDTRDN